MRKLEQVIINSLTHSGYSVSKVGMTVLAKGLVNELVGPGNNI